MSTETNHNSNSASEINGIETSLNLDPMNEYGAIRDLLEIPLKLEALNGFIADLELQKAPSDQVDLAKQVRDTAVARLKEVLKR